MSIKNEAVVRKSAVKPPKVKVKKIKSVRRVKRSKNMTRRFLALRRAIIAKRRAWRIARRLFVYNWRYQRALAKKKWRYQQALARKRSALPTIMLDTQHAGKSSNPGDTGASGFGMVEARMTDKYLNLATSMLRRDGYRVIRAGFRGFKGDYESRAQFARRMGASLYLAGHLNSGGKHYGLVETSSNAKSNSIKLLRILSSKFKRDLGLKQVEIKKLGPGERGDKCVRGAAGSMPAAILEPYFIDSPYHAKVLKRDGAHRIANAIKESVEKMVPSKKVLRKIRDK